MHVSSKLTSQKTPAVLETQLEPACCQPRDQLPPAGLQVFLLQLRSKSSISKHAATTSNQVLHCQWTVKCDLRPSNNCSSTYLDVEASLSGHSSWQILSFDVANLSGLASCPYWAEVKTLCKRQHKAQHGLQ